MSIYNIINKLNRLMEGTTANKQTTPAPDTSYSLVESQGSIKAGLEQSLSSRYLSEKAVSKAQQQAAGAALAAKRGETPKKSLKGASKEMLDMSTKELEKFAGTKHKGLPKKKTSESQDVSDIPTALRKQKGYPDLTPSDLKKSKGHLSDRRTLEKMPGGEPGRYRKEFDEMAQEKEIDYDSLQIDGIDHRDAPDFSDAYFSDGYYTDGTPIPAEVLDQLSDDYDLRYQYIEKSLYEANRVIRGNYGTEYYRGQRELDDAGDEKPSKRGRPAKGEFREPKAAPAGEKRSRGRPKNDDTPKYAGAKELQNWVVGNLPKDAKKFGNRTVHRIPDTVTESVMMVEAGALDHVLNRFKHEVKQFRNSGQLDDDLYQALFDFYLDAGEMPYGVAKARTGDPYTWVTDRLGQDLGTSVTNEVDSAESAPMDMDMDMELNELARLAGLDIAESKDKPDYIDLDKDGQKVGTVRPKKPDVSDGIVTDKSGAVHTPMSRARHLAQMAMKKQMEKQKSNQPVKEHGDVKGMHSWMEGEKRRTSMVESVSEEIEGLMKIEEEVKIGKLGTHSGTNNYGGYYHHNVTHNGKNVGRVKQNIDDAPDIYGHPGHPKSWSFTHNASKLDSEEIKDGYFKTKEDAAKALVKYHSSYMKNPSKNSQRNEGVTEGLPQTLRKVVPGYAKREIDRKMDAEKFAETEMAECGEMPMQSDTESSMNISTNMNSNGDTNITVSASGEQAAALMAMLKMAGLGDGDKARSMAIPAEEVAMEEEYANEPEEEVQTVDAIIHQGNDLHREKTQYADKPKSGDNPMATMEQVNPLDSLGSKLMQAYESIKAKK